MSKFFGKTWWGQQWLNSLSNIDYSNRLPRGSTYARNGSVKHIYIDKNTIRAKVQGSRPRPYDITIIVPPFFDAEVKQLIKALAGKPVIISKLLNRELDPEVLEIAERKGLKVFPRQWSDLKMQCSCPDWATPCKHLAAIIYKLSAEIDNNPFMVFQLHKVDLPKELEKENIFIQQASDDDIPSLSRELKPAGNKKKTEKKDTDSGEPLQEEALQSLNFSTLEPIGDSLIQLVGDSPAFYLNSGNFREKYAQVLLKSIRNAQRIITGKAGLQDYFGERDRRERYHQGMLPAADLSIGHHTTLCLSLSPNNDCTVYENDQGTALPVEQLMAVLWKIPPAQLPDYQPSVAALRTTLLLGLNLLANGAVIPQLVRVADKQFVIRWLPALLSRPVKNLVEKLEPLLPPGILRWNGREAVAEKPAVNLLSVFLGQLIHRLAETYPSDPFLNLFFDGAHFSFHEPGHESIPGGIHAWLQRYYLTQGKYRPAIVVEEVKKDKFQLTISIEERDKPLEKPLTLREVTGQKKFDQSRFEMLQSVTQLSAFIPGLDQYINSPKEAGLVMDAATFGPFLMQAIPAIRLLNINILLPRSLQSILRPKPSVRIQQKTETGTGHMRLDRLLEFDWQVAMGDQVVSQAEFNKLLRNSEGLIKYKTDYIYVSPADLEKLHKHFSAAKDLSPYDMLRAALSNEYYGAAVALSADVKALIEQLTAQAETELPACLQATLRPYQHRGYSWMVRNTRIGFGSVIADDMGLGKTLQVITTLLKYKQEGSLRDEKALVVSPTGLLTNWQAEFEKFAPSLDVRLYHGLGRKLESGQPFDVLLTSYGVVRSDAAKLRKLKWFVLVIDEAQNIKNYDSEQSKAVKSIPAGTFIAMSGTPVENRLSELWSIMDFCNRGFLGSLQEFKQSYANPIQNQHDLQVAQKLKTITGPFLLRRLKSDKSIISDLPDKIEIDSFSHLTREQASLYEQTLQKAMQAIEEIPDTDQQSLFKRQGMVLQMILALKQICNHPTQFLKNGVLDAGLSGKMDLLFSKLESIAEANEKALIFSQFTEMGSLLQQFITARYGEQPLFYHGGCTIRQRTEMVQAFQKDRANKIFVLSLKAAGTGLNLTAANHVIHYDLWWNPAVEAQATDRAYRIGQKSNVMVHRFITKNTFEEKINEMIQDKKALADLTVSAGENWIGNLSNKELKELFTLS
ncbi:MAG: DEAD/DEAH box helicase [Williamsia sp.]|nr:DEAD/DEAH box helicase [Williamsia sp.]